jgi:hypothetical protein
LTIARELGDHRFVANNLASIGALLLRKGEPEQALSYLRQAEQEFAGLGVPAQLQYVRAMIETASGR